MVDNQLDNQGVPIALHRFQELIGVSDATTTRWRAKHMLETVNILGKQYVMPEALTRFKQRAQAGEFAKEAVVPKKKALASK